MCGHGPMLAGSSCTQRTSLRFGYFASSALISVDRARVELLDPDDRRARARRPRCFLRSTIRSQVIRPEHSSTFSTLLRVDASSSPMTGRNVPSVKSLGLRGGLLALEHRLRREDDQRPVLLAERVLAQQVEVADAGVDGWATTNASSAHIVRNRSMRAEEWSGPWPS